LTAVPKTDCIRYLIFIGDYHLPLQRRRGRMTTKRFGTIYGKMGRETIHKIFVVSLALVGLLVLANVLSRERCPDRVCELIAQLKTVRNTTNCDGGHNLRTRVAEELGNTHDPRAIQPLIEALHSPDEQVVTWGGAGCTGSSGITYYAIIPALATFGPAASGALPKMIELLHDPKRRELADRILKAIKAIDPAHALDITVDRFKSAPEDDELRSTYIRALLSFGKEAQRYTGDIVGILGQAKPFTAPDYVTKAQWANLMVNLGVYSIGPVTFDALLLDPAVVSWVDPAPFRGTGNQYLGAFLPLLTSFNEYFSQLKSYRSWANGKGVEGARNALAGDLLKNLAAMCTSESIKAMDEFAEKNPEIRPSWSYQIKDCERSYERGDSSAFR
jgi:hypothetical protein